MSTTPDYLWRHLAAVPAFRALQRSIEDRLLTEHKPFAGPVLDVGVGDGQFASAVFGPSVDVGVDVSLTSLREARQWDVYRHLLAGSATSLPFPSDCFATVVSNSVIEHIPDLEATLAEMYRTLRPGGTLLLTVPTDRLEQNFLIPRLLRAAGLHTLAQKYVQWFRRKQVHYHLLSPEQWVEALRRAGFQVAEYRRYMSAQATQYFEVLHYAGWHNLLTRRLTGRWVVWPWRPRFFLTERLLKRFVDEPEHADDSCWFMLARKP